MHQCRGKKSRFAPIMTMIKHLAQNGPETWASVAHRGGIHCPGSWAMSKQAICDFSRLE